MCFVRKRINISVTLVSESYVLLYYETKVMSDVFEVRYVFHRNEVGRLQTVAVDIHSVNIVSIGIEIYIIYFFK